jgi:hypothetical protein
VKKLQWKSPAGIAIIAAAALVGVMCLLGFGGRAYGREYIPVELCHNGKKFGGKYCLCIYKTQNF